ncbi:MAG: hypothetical protein PHT54_03555 [Candidatus Nanoarchaeia archaeon]|nr:hypothetical protein [Candidatus Nanoarchaeia archaeon]
MAQPNALNPNIYGKVTAGGFQVGEELLTCSVVGVQATGVVYKHIFRNPIGFDMKIVTAWAVTTGQTNTVVTLVSTGGTVVAITMTGSGTTSRGTTCVSTSALTNNVLSASNTLQIVSSGTTDQSVLFFSYRRKE